MAFYQVDNGNSVDVLYLDFSKAFDRVPKRRLISKLQHLGISGNLLAWINAFLSERTFCVRVGESYSRPVRVHSGVPQGSVLGPLLFIAYTADLGCILRSPFAMYADDIKVYNISNQSMALEQDLLAIHDWSCDWLLPLNSDKCGVLHIGNTNPKHIYRINGKELASFDNYRDLGVTVSFDLSWSNHILKITKKANSMLFLLNKVFRKSSPAIFAKLYKTYVRPVLEFANCVWTPVLQRDIQLLESVQRRATRVPFGRSRPQYTARLSLMGIPSLSARRVRGDLLVVFRALSSEQSPIRHLFTLHEGGRTRGHSLKLLKDSVYSGPKYVSKVLIKMFFPSTLVQYLPTRLHICQVEPINFSTATQISDHRGKTMFTLSGGRFSNAQHFTQTDPSEINGSVSLVVV
ncbi:hypothetical protein GEV33_001830 [Tenebrio molitor]|uniref:Reverse transcriptase domain-containing protein n=1 Tax=Tenebrio molitor TaxID=7067 RepID=A0A8J6HW78_TENMO|nr:hypothetical protein GEV33_001830 [Tenebrio molitor]